MIWVENPELARVLPTEELCCFRDCKLYGPQVSNEWMDGCKIIAYAFEQLDMFPY